MARHGTCFRILLLLVDSSDFIFFFRKVLFWKEMEQITSHNIRPAPCGQPRSEIPVVSNLPLTGRRPYWRPQRDSTMSGSPNPSRLVFPFLPSASLQLDLWKIKTPAIVPTGRASSRVDVRIYRSHCFSPSPWPLSCLMTFVSCGWLMDIVLTQNQRKW